MLLITLVTLLCGCGGGAGGSSSLSGGGIISTTGSNVATLLVDGGSEGIINAPYVSVTVCRPGSSTCVTIDHILVDTGSVGLRIMGSLLSGINLPVAVDSAGNPFHECVGFVDGYTWGPLVTADVTIGGELASNLTINVIDDATPPSVVAPTDCSGVSPSINSVPRFGANGILGVQFFKEDCPLCSSQVIPGTYYICPGSVCQGATVTFAQQVHNPVIHFATNNNGIIIQLPSISSAGAFGARGALIFGIDTQSNNTLGTATALTVDPVTGYLSTFYYGQNLTKSFFDSGSSGNYFNDSALPQCTSGFAQGFYCPASVQTLSATIVSYNGVSKSVNFNVANAETLTNNQPDYTAFANLAGTNPISTSFDWGLPFFFGKSVYVAIEGQTTSSGTGPFIAY
ncbi:MAG: DUF3443 domain-containing protein [Steroidobacteraceae bacterium]